MSSLIWIALLLGDLAGAEAALSEGKPQQALDKLGEVADLDAANQRTLVVLGMAYYRLGEHVAAVEPLMRASNNAPADQKLARAAALACRGSARGKYAAEYIRDARRMAKRAGDRSLQADLAYLARDYEAALAYYRDAPAPNDKTRAMVYARRRAECIRALGIEEDVRAAYIAAVDAALAIPDLRSAYQLAFRGNVAGRLLQWLDTALTKTPDDIELRRYRGYARTAALRYEDAIGDLEFVVARRPKDWDAKDQLCFVLLQDGARRQVDAHFARADKLGREILTADPRHRGAWDRLSWLAGKHWAARKLETAAEILQFLYKIDPEDVTNGLNYGALCRRLDRQKTGEAVYRGLLKLWPNDPDLINDWAIFVDGQGRRAEAVKLWERVLELAPRNLNALENLYTAAWERGDQSTVRALVPRGIDASRRNERAHIRWLWFRDRTAWAPAAWEPRKGAR